MYDTFEVLRRAAEDSREADRQLHGGIDPVGWEALLDRVEDQLEGDDREGDAVPEPLAPALLRSGARREPLLSLLANGRRFAVGGGGVTVL
ncbi:hypothetical protein [Streptomyces sp. NPDC018031]|uniref:hypothetical protein n=1 Tax=Streptomyces sp. NPDC018031 TaxID=3365033 RepID=UPI0037B940C1